MPTRNSLFILLMENNMPLYKYPKTYNNNDVIENVKKIRSLSPRNSNAQNVIYKKHLKDFIKSFFYIILIFLLKKRNKTYLAFIPDGGLGDILRQKAVIASLTKMSPDIIIDIYHKATKPLVKDLRNIRFFLNKNSIYSTTKKYDIIIDNTVSLEYPQINIINRHNPLSKTILNNIETYKKIYPFCFNDISSFDMQKLAIKNNLHLINVSKIKSGVDKNYISDISLNIEYRKVSLLKFGIYNDIKYITFQTGTSNKGNIAHTKSWRTDHWKNLIALLKDTLSSKNIKIVQVGVGQSKIDSDIDLVGKTNLDELCCVLKKSLLHIDTDSGCMHIAKALKVKSLILFGPTNAEYILYSENINIASSLCGGCHVINNWHEKCVLEYNPQLCMNSLTPGFVYQKVIENI